MYKHILFVLENFYPEYRAGTETYVYHLAKNLIKKGWQVSVIIAAVGKKSYKYNLEGINVYALSVPEKISAQELNGLQEPSNLTEFKNKLTELKPDIVHFHSFSRSFTHFHIKEAFLIKARIVFTPHIGGNFCVRGDLQLLGKGQCNGLVEKQRCLACFINKNKNLNQVLSNLMAWGINNLLFNSPLKNKFPALHVVKYKIAQLETVKKYADINIAIAPWLKQVFILNGLKKTKLVSQGINAGFVNQGILPTKKYILPVLLIFVGRMHPDKGFHLLIESLKNFTPEIFNLVVVTIPFSDEAAYYQKMKSEYKRLKYNQWFENLLPTDVAKKIEDADILILPSKYEVASLVVLEAFAKNVPVIGSDYVAIQDMVEHNFNGLLFKNGDSKSLTRQLQKISKNSGIIKNLKENIDIPRTFEDVADDMDKVYKKLLNEII